MKQLISGACRIAVGCGEAPPPITAMTSVYLFCLRCSPDRRSRQKLPHRSTILIPQYPQIQQTSTKIEKIGNWGLKNAYNNNILFNVSKMTTRKRGPGQDDRRVLGTYTTAQGFGECLKIEIIAMRTNKNSDILFRRDSCCGLGAKKPNKYFGEAAMKTEKMFAWRKQYEI